MILIFSDKYFESSMVFAFLMLNFMLWALANLLGYSNLSVEYSKIPIKANIVSMTISITGSILFITEFGYIGAAYALIIMNTICAGIISPLP